MSDETELKNDQQITDTQSRYVCRDKHNNKIYEGDRFRVVDSSVIANTSECWFFWRQNLLRFGLKIKRLDPRWATCGSVSQMGQPWRYTGQSIEKMPIVGNNES